MRECHQQENVVDKKHCGLEMVSAVTIILMLIQYFGALRQAMSLEGGVTSIA